MNADLQADIADYTLTVPDDDTLTVHNSRGATFTYDFNKRVFQRKFFAAYTPRKKPRSKK